MKKEAESKDALARGRLDRLRVILQDMSIDSFEEKVGDAKKILDEVKEKTTRVDMTFDSCFQSLTA